MNIELCEIGVITKPQGLKGHFRVRQNYSNFSILSKVKVVVIQNKEYEDTCKRPSFLNPFLYIHKTPESQPKFNVVCTPLKGLSDLP